MKNYFYGLSLCSVILFFTACGENIETPQIGTEEEMLKEKNSLTASVMKDSFVQRSNLTKLNITPDHNVLLLNLFNDTIIHTMRSRVEIRDNGFSWFGKIEGIEGSDVILVVTHDGHITGNINAVTHFYHIQPSHDGLHLITEVDRGKFNDHDGERKTPRRSPPKAMSSLPCQPNGVDDDLENCALVNDLLTEDDAGEHGNTGSTGNTGGSPPSNYTVSILIVYSDDAEQDSNGNMASEAQLAIDEANQALLNSMVNTEKQKVSFKLAAIKSISYTETGDASKTLNDLENPSDGKIDTIHQWRDYYKADIVSFWVKNIDWCGQGNQMPSLSSYPSRAFNVVMRSCGTNYYTLSHEVGHNMGLNHDQYVNDSDDATYYAYGFIQKGSFRTMLAYPDECYDSNKNCPKILYFSNPTVRVNGLPTGIWDTKNKIYSYNADVIRNSFPIVAAYR